MEIKTKKEKENEAKIFRGNEHNDNHLRKEIKSNHVCVDNELAVFFALLCRQLK